MTYTETQIEAIKLFGKKDLTEGCMVWYVWTPNTFGYKIISYDQFDCPINWDSECVRAISTHRKQEIYSFDSRDWEWKRTITFIKWNILWHIPHLEDLFRVAEEKGFWVICYKDWLEIYIWQWEDENMQSIDYNPTLSLLDQPSLQDIISLFK